MYKLCTPRHLRILDTIPVITSYKITRDLIILNAILIFNYNSEKSILNAVESNEILIVITFFRLIWLQTEFRW